MIPCVFPESQNFVGVYGDTATDGGGGEGGGTSVVASSIFIKS